MSANDPMECPEPADRFDIDGNPCTLSKLCRLEPDWATNRIRAMEADIEAGWDAAVEAGKAIKEAKP